MKKSDEFIKLSPFQNILFKLGAVMMLAGLLCRMYDVRISFYIFSIGVMFFSLMEIRMAYIGKDFILKRLRRQQLLSCVCFLASALFMSMQLYQYGTFRRNEWTVALLIATVLLVYSTLRINYILEKDQKNINNLNKL